MYRHSLKISELLDAVAELFSQLQHVEVELRTYIRGKPCMSHLETTYKDDIIWMGKPNLNIAVDHGSSRTCQGILD